MKLVPSAHDRACMRLQFIAAMLDVGDPISVTRARAAAHNDVDPYPYGEEPSFRYRAFYRFTAKYPARRPS